MSLENPKIKIKKSFSKQAATYECYAGLQRQSAIYFMEFLKEVEPLIPAGPILEVGSGSGLLSLPLVARFREAEFYLLDMAPGMLRRCRSRLQDEGQLGARIHFVEMDAEELAERERYGLIVSGLTLQWFADLKEGLRRLLAGLIPGGVLLFSIIAKDSFAEWRAHCSTSQVPCTVNPLPDTHEIEDFLGGQGHEIRHWQRRITLKYPSVPAFFHSLKGTGAAVRLQGTPLRVSEMRRLIAKWQGREEEEIGVTYVVDYFAAVR